MLLQHKTVVITGCLSGIGKAAMEVFAKNGADIFACAYEKSEEFEAEAERISNENKVSIIPVYFDMLDRDSMKAAVKNIQKEKKKISALVNIAGIALDATFQMTSMDQIQKTFQVNTFAQIELSQYITKLMLRTGEGGSVIFTSSITGLDGNIGQVSYGGSKGALVSIAKTMSKELGQKGIRVNVVAPGVINTAMTKAVLDTILEDKVSHISIGRIGEPEEVANVMMFLVSDYSNYITGQVIRVDGGMMK